MAPVPPFSDICQWQNFPGNLNTWPNTSPKRFFLLPFLQSKKNVQKSMLLHWCCPLSHGNLRQFFSFVILHSHFRYQIKIMQHHDKNKKNNESWSKTILISGSDLSMLFLRYKGFARIFFPYFAHYFQVPERDKK